jgi:hypothetical protein
LRRHKYGPHIRPLADRFWAKVNKNGPLPAALLGPLLGPCWLWTGAKSGKDYKVEGKGYGVISIDADGAMKGAHVVAFFLEHGRWPQEGRSVCHQCNVTLCVRPSHLYEGTSRDNMQQCVRDRRHRARGPATKPNRPRVPSTVISAEMRLAVERLYATGEYSYPALAKVFRISPSSVANIVNNISRVKEEGRALAL